MNINSSIHNLRYAAPRNLEKNIVNDIKEDVIEEVQSQPLQEQTVEQGYGNANSSQYLANMGIKIVSYNKSTPQLKEEIIENPTLKQQVEQNTTQIATSRTANAANTANTSSTNNTAKASDVAQTKSVPHTPVATSAATVTSSSGSNIGSDLYNSTGELIQEITRYKASGGILPPEVAANYEKLVKMFMEDPASINQLSMDFAAKWIETQDLSKFASTEEATLSCLKDFYSEELGLNLTNIAKTIGGAAITSVLLKIGISTVIDVAPDMGKDVFNLGKKTFKNLIKLNIGGLIKNTMIDAPVLVVRNMGRSVKALAKNTYQTARDIVVAGVGGAYNTAKTAITGTFNTITKPIKGVAKAASNVLNGVGNGFKKLANGNVIGAVGSVVGGVAKGVGTVVSTAAKTVGSAVKTVTKTVGKALDAAADVAEKVFGNPVKAVGNVVKSVGKAIGKIFKGW